MVPTIVGLSVVIVGLVVWVVWLTVALYDVRDTAADAIDAQTTIYMALNNRVKLLEPKEYPKYLGTLTGSQIEADERECGTPDPVWGEHDARVADAITHRMRGKGIVNEYPAELLEIYRERCKTGVITTEAEEHPFFKVADADESQMYDDDTAHRLSQLHNTVTDKS